MNEIKEVWLTGRLAGKDEQWHIQGIFLTEDEAVNACRNDYYFVVPVPFGVELPHETMPHDIRGRYPLLCTG